MSSPITPINPDKIESIAAHDRSLRPSPFAKGESFGSRAGGAFGRLLRFPLGLLGEITQSPLARKQRAAQNLQRDLAEEITGEEVPFSSGRRIANMLSMGLIEGNPTGEIIPENLGPSGREIFDGMSDLQQRIVQARSAEDFAELLGNDEAFKPAQPQSAVGQVAVDESRLGLPALEGATQTAQTVTLNPGQGRAAPGDVGAPGVRNPSTPQTLAPGQVAFQDGEVVARNDSPRILSEGSAPLNADGTLGPRNEGPIRVGKDERVITPTGGELTNPQGFTLSEGQERFDEQGQPIASNQPTLVTKTNPGDLIKSGFDPRSFDAADRFGFAALQYDPTAQSRIVDEIEAKRQAGQFSTIDKVLGSYNQQVKPFIQLGEKFRAVLGSFRANPNDIPENIRNDLIEAGISPDKMESSAIADIAMIFGFMKILDRESTVREGEAAMVASARRLGFPVSIVSQILKGESLRPEQRIEIISNIRSTFQQQLTGYAITRSKYLDIARAGGLENPEVAVPNYLEDLTSFVDDAMQSVIEERRSSAEEVGTVFDAALTRWTSTGGDEQDIPGFTAFLKDEYGLDIAESE